MPEAETTRLRGIKQINELLEDDSFYAVDDLELTSLSYPDKFSGKCWFCFFIVDYLIDTYGFENIINLSADEIETIVLPEEEFRENWICFLKEKYSVN